MYNFKKHKITLNICLIGMIVSALLLAAVLWNSHLASGKILSLGWIILLIIIFICFGLALFLTAYHFSDKQKFETYIKVVRDEEKLKTFKEEEKIGPEEKEEDKQLDINEVVDSIIPDLRGVKNIDSFSNKLLANLSKHIEIIIGLCYHAEKKTFNLSGKYALTREPSLTDFKIGEALPGQAAKNKEIIIVNEIPENYFQVESGMGKSLPRCITFLPVLFENVPVAVIEMATFNSINETQLNLLNELKNNRLGEQFAKLIKK